MALGHGKYGAECTQARLATKAEALLLIVIGGESGNGFELQCINPAIVEGIPRILEDTARQIREASR